MDPYENPFFVLKVTPRDNRRTIVERSDELSLTMDASICSAALATLTNPRKRLSAEVAWFPGLGPKRVEAALSALSGHLPDQNERAAFSPLGRANMVSAGLSRTSDNDPLKIAEWGVALASAFEAIDPCDVRAVVNEERVASGFPEISDQAIVEEALDSRRQHYRTIMREALDRLPSDDLVHRRNPRPLDVVRV